VRSLLWLQCKSSDISRVPLMPLDLIGARWQVKFSKR